MKTIEILSKSFDLIFRPGSMLEEAEYLIEKETLGNNTFSKDYYLIEAKLAELMKTSIYTACNLLS